MLSTYLKQAASDHEAAPGAAVAVHSFGDFQQFNPHLHIIATDGCFSAAGTFTVSQCSVAKDLEDFFRYEVFKMLKTEGKISDAVIENMLGWRHSGFNVYCGPTIWSNNDKGLETLARYIIRACFSQERMSYIPAKDSMNARVKVIYSTKNGRTSKTFDALDWLAQLMTHVPNKGEQTVRYYGYYSNKSRGMRKKAQMDDHILTIVPSHMSSKQFRQNWARLIQKIYEVDPLVCPKCQGHHRLYRGCATN